MTTGLNAPHLILVSTTHLKCSTACRGTLPHINEYRAIDKQANNDASRPRDFHSGILSAGIEVDDKDGDGGKPSFLAETDRPE